MTRHPHQFPESRYQLALTIPLRQRRIEVANVSDESTDLIPQSICIDRFGPVTGHRPLIYIGKLGEPKKRCRQLARSESNVCKFTKQIIGVVRQAVCDKTIPRFGAKYLIISNEDLADYPWLAEALPVRAELLHREEANGVTAFVYRLLRKRKPSAVLEPPLP